eukprot:CAMPEP_0201282900 /NCGR_PEP_ID=MMETSP1317-20130820/6991_1 /ASSEMBLY_ACC=CAM_ASM_000770 /TAXON_ID=187299 /ORGANISM="Undescribed Undescribed, Strain Undescribed" /LENGTH=57 /DNA_ID=CAMNT_0047597179 /DNA_START=65 /DNA_END=238 /DNA_ORIENTATION=-
MAYAYFKSGRHLDQAVFDVFFRKCPFKGEFCIFGGLSRVLDFLKNYRITPKMIEHLK